MFDWAIALAVKQHKRIKDYYTAPKTKAIINEVIDKGRKVYKSNNITIWKYKNITIVLFNRHSMTWVFDGELNFDEIVQTLEKQFADRDVIPSKYFEVCFDDLFKELIEEGKAELLGKNWKDAYTVFKLKYREG